jgi:Asp-tRNA(Asn)/Glu-tRNA(Gln) amidotransferase A subunit family amidase
MRQWMKSAANPQGYDLLITPAVAIPAFDAKPAGHTPMTCEAMLGWTPFSYPFNLTQQAACAIPCGLTKDGLPIGLEIVGSMFGDALVLRAARRMNNCSYFLGLAYSKRNKSRASVSRNVMNARKMW